VAASWIVGVLRRSMTDEELSQVAGLLPSTNLRVLAKTMLATARGSE
jgi:hypothetical protein